MRRTRPGLWLLSSLLVVGACRQAPTPAASPSGGDGTAAATRPLPNPLPEVVARVNGQPIKARLLQFVANEGRPLQGLSEEQRAAAYRKTLGSLIERELLLQEALARGQRADDRAVEAAYDQLRGQYADEDAWRASLARQGLDEGGFRFEVRARMTVQALVNAEAAKQPDVSAAEARAYYDAHAAEFETGERCAASHILIRQASGAAAAAAARARAEAALARLRKGADFAQVAREVSEDESSAKRGGELPELRRAQMEGSLAAEIFKLKPGEISNVVVTPYGLTIVKMRELRPSRRLTFEEVQAQLQQRLQGGRQRETIARLVETLRQKASIETAF